MIIAKGEKFTHPVTKKKKYKIKQFLTCISRCVVYVLQCLCPKLYVGEPTNECRLRLSSHKSTIRMGKNELPVPRHFNEMGHNINEL